MRTPGHSPFKARSDPRHAASLARIHPDDVHEFYHPFAMLEDLPLELVRVVSPRYGAMDMILLLQPQPVQVYVNTDAGERFMRERFPNARTTRVPEASMRLLELDRGMAMLAELRQNAGPIRELSLVVSADPNGAIGVERYESPRVWGSPINCHGIDLRQSATARGFLELRGKSRVALSTPTTIFRGSYGKLTPMDEVKGQSARRRSKR
jgi:hypothetical protein